MKKVVEIWRRSRETLENVGEQDSLREFENIFKNVRESAALLEQGAFSAKILSKEEELLSFILEDYLTIELEKSILFEKTQTGAKRPLSLMEPAAIVKNRIRQIVDDTRSGNQRNHDVEGLFGEYTETPYKLLVARKDVQQFIGVDGKKHGPLRPGDLTTIPTTDAEILISDTLAESLE